MSLGHLRVLLLDVSVEMVNIDFFEPRIKTARKYNYTQKMCNRYYVYSLCLCSMFWPRPICPGHGNWDHDQKIILEFYVSRGRGRGSGKTSQQCFFRQKLIKNRGRLLRRLNNQQILNQYIYYLYQFFHK